MQLCSLNLEELKKWVQGAGYKSFVAKQIFEWVYQKKEFNFDQMSNLKRDLREDLNKNFTIVTLKLVKTEDSKDLQTTKFLWELEDEKRVESVLIRSNKRRTLCISSQVGCPAKCSFCASGKEGLFRNLSISEIVEQALLVDQYLQNIGERLSHIVFMGMGEPLENYEAVVDSIKLLCSPDTFGISQRRITISTVGVVDKIYQLIKEDLKINLVLSLHAPNQHVRKKIIPYARRYPLGEILSAMQAYFRKTKRDLTFEYTLIDGINAEVAHAEELSQLLKGKHCSVNLIPYNPVDGLKLARPPKEKIEQFRSTLQDRGIPTTWRYTKGKDIAAACGQLALQKKTPLSIYGGP